MHLWLMAISGKTIRRITGDRRGAVTFLFAVAALTLLAAVGSGIDLVRAYIVRQQVSAVAELTCQYANRSSVVLLAFGSGGISSYNSNVNSYYALAFGYQNASWTQATPTPFSATLGGPGIVTLSTSVSTLIMKIVGIDSLPIGVSLQCFSILASGPQQPVPDATATTLVNEGFENAINIVSWYEPTGTYMAWQNGSTIPLVTTAPKNAGYVGVAGNEWVIMGYCLEVDGVGKLISTEPEGTHNAQLDCDNGYGTKGNSSISTKVYLNVGAYELRWYYAGYIYNMSYGASYICGTTAADTAWATDASYSGGFGPQTDQINIYLDQNITGSPPTHTTLYGNETLAGSNLIDECVYSDGWIERRIPITVTTAGYYWLSLAADGTDDSFGGLVDNIQLCKNTCSATIPDNFPASWLSTSNGGNNVVLFEDNFESPSYSGTYYDTTGNVSLSVGSSSVWSETGKGWSNWALNELPYWRSGCPQGKQCIELGWNDTTSNTDVGIARPFLLVPGYYQISYEYVSENTFSGLSGVYCGATPASASIATLTGGSGTATDRVLGVNHGTLKWSSGMVGVFIAHAQMASEPNVSTTYGTTTTYTNADYTVTSSPIYASNTINLTSYNAAQANPLLDICGYAATAQTRTRDVFIEKPALYWLIFSILGTYTSFGAQIDDVKITALGSPYMNSAPSAFVTVPVPNPQPTGTISYTGFSITSEPY